MKHYFLLAIIFLAACSKEDSADPIEPNEIAYISSVDLSSLPQIESAGIVFYNSNGRAESVLTTLKNNGVNTVRLRIWNNPTGNHSTFEEVKAFSKKIKELGLKIWITVHYSDTWADPGHQETPTAWQGLPYSSIENNVFDYTKKIVAEINPDFIQIGNEINSGFLFPYGNIQDNESQFVALLSTAIKAVRNNSDRIKIIMHYAGIDGSDWFYNKIKSLDYDIIGLSYYPIWHGKNLDELKATLSNLSTNYNKDILIAETSYPFTLEWNDWTNNVVGGEDHLILPEYTATPQGQKKFIAKIKTIISTTQRGIGFCYWGGELVAFHGQKAKNGSSWENQALYDFDNTALPVIAEFEIE